MTEDEAKTKWCPASRVIAEWQQNIASGNRGLAENERPSALCIGSACMAWRWAGAFPLPDDPPEIRNRYDSGYCGLGGEP